VLITAPKRRSRMRPWQLTLPDVFLSQKDGDETQLAIEGLKFLRGDR
jgi:hypothetical protein